MVLVMADDSDDEAKKRRDQLQVFFKKHGNVMRSRKEHGKWIEAMHSDQAQSPPGPPSGPTSDQLAWVREAIDGLKASLDKAFDGLKHSQSQANSFVKWALGLTIAAIVGIVGWQTSQISAIGNKMDAMEQRIVARIDMVGRDVVDVRDRVSKLEGQIQGISEQLAKSQRGALDLSEPLSGSQ
jgi:hypothetical protein